MAKHLGDLEWPIPQLTILDTEAISAEDLASGVLSLSVGLDIGVDLRLLLVQDIFEVLLVA